MGGFEELLSNIGLLLNTDADLDLLVTLKRKDLEKLFGSIGGWSQPCGERRYRIIRK